MGMKKKKGGEILENKELEKFMQLLGQVTGEEPIPPNKEVYLRFIWIEDAPFGYGFGLDTPATPFHTQYWVVPPYLHKGWRVYSRSIDGANRGPWVLQDPFPFVEKGKNTGRRGRPDRRRDPLCKICENTEGDVCDIQGRPCPYATALTSQ
jgi:hypothetical protein